MKNWFLYILMLVPLRGWSQQITVGTCSVDGGSYTGEMFRESLGEKEKQNTATETLTKVSSIKARDRGGEYTPSLTVRNMMVSGFRTSSTVMASTTSRMATDMTGCGIRITSRDTA